MTDGARTRLSPDEACTGELCFDICFVGLDSLLVLEWD